MGFTLLLAALTSTVLPAARAADTSRCKCISPVDRGNVPLSSSGHVVYKSGADSWNMPSDYGSECAAWDMPEHMGGIDPWGCGSATSGSCLDTWCYVDPCDCEGVSDASQTMMFAATYATAQKLAYSYDKCAACSARTSKDECAKHTRCAWDDATSTCQTSTSDQYTAKRCEALNQETDVTSACAEKLNCKLVNGQCVVRSSEERAEAWQCGNSQCKCISPVEMSYVPIQNGSVVYVGSSGSFNLPGTYGSSCAAWDMPENMGGLDPWGCSGATSGSCLDTWCYVDPCMCHGVSDASQTNMFASTYSTANKLAYSYDTCASCTLRVTETECGKHTRCKWDTATFTCQTSTSDEFTAKRCEAVNQESDVSQACSGKLNCKMVNGQCTVRTSQERSEAWQCTTSKCRCISLVERGNVPLSPDGYVVYKSGADSWNLPSKYGSECAAWDMPVNMGGIDPWGCGGSTSGSCLDTWCYVDPCDCEGVSDASQTMMFAATYATAHKLAYSYDRCAACSARTSKDECAQHTRCTWDDATSTCQTSTSDEYTAKRCEALNQEADVASACAAKLNCKLVNGQCIVRSSEERAEAWQCGNSQCKCISPVEMKYVPIQNGSIRYVGSSGTWNLPSTYGSTCAAWDMPENMGGVDPWGCGGSTSGSCLDTFCYVDPCKCQGVADASQTMMFAGTYSTASKLAYSYDTCAACNRRTNKQDCAGHTRCIWDDATSTCQTSTTDEYSAKRCEALNQESDVRTACKSRLNCKMVSSQCTVRSSEERAAAWKCARQQQWSPVPASMCTVSSSGNVQCAQIEDQQCFDSIPDADIAQLQRMLAGTVTLRPMLAYRDRATSRLVAQIMRIVISELLGIPTQLKDLGQRADTLIFGLQGDLVPGSSNPFEVDLDMEVQVDRLGEAKADYDDFVVKLDAFLDLGNLGYSRWPGVFVAGATDVELDMMQTWRQLAQLPKDNVTLLSKFPVAGKTGGEIQYTPRSACYEINMEYVCHELWLKPISYRNDLDFLLRWRERKVPFALVTVTANIVDMVAGLGADALALYYMWSPSLENVAAGGVQVTFPRESFPTAVLPWKAGSSRLASLLPVAYQVAKRMQLSSEDITWMLREMSAQGATMDQGQRPHSSTLEFEVACAWIKAKQADQHGLPRPNLEKIKQWLPICTSIKGGFERYLENGICVIKCPLGWAPDPRNPADNCLPYADGAARTCNVGEALSVPGFCIVDSGNVTCKQQAICVTSGGLYLVCPADRFDDRVMLLHQGWMTANESSIRCSRCPRGSFTSTIGSVSCLPSPAGMFVPTVGSPSAEPCPRGSYTPEAGYHMCLLCSEGTFQDIPGQTACKSCEEYLPGTTTKYRDSTKVRGADSNRYCGCPDGSYWKKGETRLIDATLFTMGSCHVCGEGLLCPGGREGRKGELFVRQMKGYWSDPADPFSVFECYIKKMCPGGPIGKCAYNGVGRMCNECEVGYVMFDGSCQKCLDMETSKALFPIVPALFAVPGVIVVYKVMGLDSHGTTGWLGTKNLIFTVVFLTTNYFQSIGLLVITHVPKDQDVDEVWNWFEFLNSFITLLRPACTGTDFTMSFIVQTLFPAIVLILFVLVYFASLSTNARLDANSMINGYGALLFLFYTGVVRSSIKLFNCFEHPNGIQTLLASATVVCEFDGTWRDLIGVTIAAVLIFVVGVTALLTWVVWNAPVKFASDPGFRKRWAFAFKRFRPSVHWWSLVWLTRLTLMNVMIVLQDPFWQTYSLFLVMTFYLIASSSYSPWRHVNCNNYDIWICMNILGIIMLLFASEGLPDSGAPTVLILSTTFFPAAAASYVFLRVLLTWQRHKTHSHSQSMSELAKSVQSTSEAVVHTDSKDLHRFLMTLDQLDVRVLKTYAKITSPMDLEKCSKAILRKNFRYDHDQERCRLCAANKAELSESQKKIEDSGYHEERDVPMVQLEPLEEKCPLKESQGSDSQSNDDLLFPEEIHIKPYSRPLVVAPGTSVSPRTPRSVRTPSRTPPLTPQGSPRPEPRPTSPKTPRA